MASYAKTKADFLGGSTKPTSASSGGNANTTPTATASKPTYTAPTYKESDIVTQAKSALDAQLAQKPGAYQSHYQDQIGALIDQITNRDKFSYDLNADAL